MKTFVKCWFFCSFDFLISDFWLLIRFAVFLQHNSNLILGFVFGGGGGGGSTLGLAIRLEHGGSYYGGGVFGKDLCTESPELFIHRGWSWKPLSTHKEISTQFVRRLSILILVRETLRKKCCRFFHHDVLENDWLVQHYNTDFEWKSCEVGFCPSLNLKNGCENR